LKLAEWLFKFRGYTPIPFFVVALLLAQPQKDLVIFGAILITFGEFVRLWGVSYAGGSTRTRNVGAPKLVTNGPFAHMRNPLYLGNIFMYTGAIIAIGGWLPHLMWLVIFYFSFQYMLITRLEEAKLLELFGDDYEQYKNAVPSYFPRLSPYPGRTRVKPDLLAALKSEKSTFVNILVFTILFILRWVSLNSG
jgi:protein-S-isoprenylcysteine O-methyltransferase Ste14